MELVRLNDYRTFMQDNAAAFIDRHHQEHLDSDALRERTVLHLVEAWEVPQFMAGRLADLAMSEPRGIPEIPPGSLRATVTTAFK